MLSDAAKARIRELMARYPDSRSAIMPALYVAQEEHGWLPETVLDELAALLGLTTTEVGSVASFYSMYFLKPRGRHVIDFCNDLPCALLGADQELERLRAKLGLKEGEETTSDGAITLRPAMCLGGCDKAFVLLLDNAQQYENMTDEKLDALLRELHAQEKSVAK